jgi:hypothetical protein
MPAIRSFSRTHWKTFLAPLFFVLAAVVPSPSPTHAQAPGFIPPDGALGAGKPAPGVGHLVNPRELPAQRGKQAPTEAPFLPPPGYAQAKARAMTEPLASKPALSQPNVISARSSVRLDSKPPSSPSRHTSGRPGHSPKISGSGNLLNQVDLIGNYHCDVGFSCHAPPDTQVAAGFNEIVETTNNEMQVFSKGGASLQYHDLTSFFLAASDQTATDAKVVFDAAAGRYYMTDLLVNNNATGNRTGSQAKLAVSQSSDPTGSWCIYSFGFFTRTDGTNLDQPKLGFSDDKIMISVNENGSTPEDFDVLQKSDVLAGCSGVAGTAFSNGDFNLVPVISLSSTSDLYAVFNGFQQAKILDITGTPAAGDVGFTETDQGINVLNTPPQAVQPPFPSGATAPIDSGDNRYLTAVFQFGRIWAGADDACNPGDGTHACMRFDEFDTTNGFNVLADVEIGAPGLDLYFPAISLDSSGNIFFVYTVSSSTVFATMQTGATTLPFSSSFPAFNIFSGNLTYQCTFCKNADGSLQPRWGDYSGAGQDPNNPSTIWLAGEFGATSSLGQNGWSTGIVALTLDVASARTAFPSAGPNSYATLVDIHGGGFVYGGTSVFFGGVASPSVNFISTDEVTALTPTEAPGFTAITPQTANGFGFSFTGFDFHPTVAGVKPIDGPTSGGNSVHIFGTGFTGASKVSFGGVAASFVVNDDGDITASTPPGAAGTVDVIVTTNGETSATSFVDQYTYVVPPVVTGVNPNVGPTSGSTSVSVTGSEFTGASTVTFGSVATFFTANNGNSITAVSPTHAAGTVDVMVTTPGGGTSATSSADQFTYDAPPTVSSVSPHAGPTGGGNTVTINGTNFVPGASVKFGTTASATVTFVSATQLKAVAPANAAGTVDVTATTPGGTSAIATGDQYAYGPPTVSSFTPTSGITGSTVTINGTSFVTGATAKFGTTASPKVTILSGTQIKATVPNGGVTGQISVTTPAGTGTSASNFTVTLSITGFSPTSGPAGTVVTITGIGFNSSSSVKFNGTLASSVTHVSSTQLMATVPSTATTGPITVTNTTAPKGTVRSAAKYTKT